MRRCLCRGCWPEQCTWRIGHAPAAWTALLNHLRRVGHADAAIEAAGLARRSSRGTLIDMFRDRAIFPIKSEDGQTVAFIGRARPGGRADTPKYLNSPGNQPLDERRGPVRSPRGPRRAGRGARPVIVESPFDAIAVSIADPRQFAGAALVGTALTGEQASPIRSAEELQRSCRCRCTYRPFPCQAAR